jgi:hypothetical protein
VESDGLCGAEVGAELRTESITSDETSEETDSDWNCDGPIESELADGDESASESGVEKVERVAESDSVSVTSPGT